MKIQRLFTFYFIISFFLTHLNAQNFIQINGNLKSKSPINNLILSQFNGQETPVTDAKVADGKFTFYIPKEAFHPGVYRIILNPQQRLFVDVIIADTLSFDISLDADKPEGAATFKDSPLNTKWYNYKEAALKAQERNRALLQFIDIYPDKSNVFYGTVIKETEREIKEFEIQFNKFIRENKDNLAGKMVANKPFFFPNIKLPLKGQEKEFQAKYWKGIEASDPSLLRTPLYVEHILAYFGFFLQEQPGPEADLKLQTAVDSVMIKFGKNKETADFARQFLTEGFKQLDKPALLQYLDETYSATQQCSDELEEKELKDRLAAYNALKIGFNPPDIKIPDYTGNASSFLESPADTLILVFWATWCPHCQQMLPILKEKIANKKNWAVVAVSVDDDKEAFEKVMKEYPMFRHYCDLQKWKSQPVMDYHINATPSFFMFDKKRTLQGKYPDIRQIPF
ncbi:MAG: AhpC/TSA family protein [Bacteroidetes bacterium]|nr:AhpC/TSA family protein [Bacteroidota bacterium]